MSGLEIRELECFLALSEDLHSAVPVEGCRTRRSAWCGGGPVRRRGYGRCGGPWTSCAGRPSPAPPYPAGAQARRSAP
jgi:hypothetical protein